MTCQLLHQPVGVVRLGNDRTQQVGALQARQQLGQGVRIECSGQRCLPHVGDQPLPVDPIKVDVA